MDTNSKIVEMADISMQFILTLMIGLKRYRELFKNAIIPIHTIFMTVTHLIHNRVP